MPITPEKLLDITAEASHRLYFKIREAYMNGRIENFLSAIGMEDLYPSKPPIYDTYSDGKVLIIGDSRIKEHVIYGIAKEFGIGKDRVELHLDYKRLKNFAFPSLQYNPNYRLVLFGPAPHSCEGKQEKDSIITKLENDDGYPRVVRLTDSNGLKITKSNIREAFRKETQSGFLAV